MGFRGFTGANGLRERFNGGAFARTCGRFRHSDTCRYRCPVADSSSIAAYQPAGPGSAIDYGPYADNETSTARYAVADDSSNGANQPINQDE